MATKESLLKDRKARKRSFVVKESKFSARVKSRWRYPRGKHSKVRQQHKGRPLLPGPGFGAARAIRGLDQTGLERIHVKHVRDLANLDPKTQGIILSSTLGMKKRMALLEEAEKQGFTLLDKPDAKNWLSSLRASFDERKKAKAQVSKARAAASEAKKKAAAKKKAETKKESAPAASEKEKKEQERELMEKTVTAKQ